MNGTGFDKLAFLERTGALRVLVTLLDDPLYITQLIRRGSNEGIATQPAIEKTRTALSNLGLIEEYEVFMELTKKTRLYLRLTKKGREVAEGVKKVALRLSKP